MKTERPSRISVRLKLAVTAAVVIALLAGWLVTFYDQQMVQEGRSGLLRRAFAVAYGLANESEYGLQIGNKPLLQRSVANALAQHDVVAAVLFDEQGRLMAVAGRMDAAAEHRDGPGLVARFQKPGAPAYETASSGGETDWISLPVKMKPASVALSELPDDVGAEPARKAGQLLGVARIAMSHRSTIQRMAEARHAAILITVLSAMIAAGLCLLVVRRMLSPLDALARGTERLAGGDLDSRVSVASRDEIGSLAAAFNRMAEALQQSHREVLSYQHDLERRVADRTAELKESRDFLNSVISESPIAMWILDVKGESLLCNKALQQLFNIPATDPGLTYNIFNDPELRDQGHLAAARQVLDQGRTATFTTRYDGARVNHAWSPAVRPQTLEWTLFPLQDTAGRVKNIVVILVDLTQQRQVEAQLRQAEKLAAVGQLGAGVAHEINNPMTGIMGYTQLMLKQGGPDHPFRRFLEIIERESQRCKKIVQNLLAYSRPADEILTLQDIHQVVDHALELMRNQAALRNVILESRFDGGIPRLRLNPNQMVQVLMNLITNALDVMPNGGRIILSCSQSGTGDKVFLSVADSGHGIPEENLQRIFEPFFTTKENWRGTGLGLTVCYKIVEEHGGRISARNRPEGGAEFLIELPVPVAAGV